MVGHNVGESLIYAHLVSGEIDEQVNKRMMNSLLIADNFSIKDHADVSVLKLSQI